MSSLILNHVDDDVTNEGEETDGEQSSMREYHSESDDLDDIPADDSFDIFDDYGSKSTISGPLNHDLNVIDPIDGPHDSLRIRFQVETLHDIIQNVRHKAVHVILSQI